jgi:hypothetical protein
MKQSQPVGFEVKQPQPQPAQLQGNRLLASHFRQHDVGSMRVSPAGFVFPPPTPPHGFGGGAYGGGARQPYFNPYYAT